MSKSVKNKFISGVIWSGASRYITLGIQFIITIFLARILSPSDYGIIGLLSVFSAVSLIIVDSGFGLALIQKGNASEVDYSSVFYFNILLGVLLYFILFFASPLIAQFYNNYELELFAKIIFLVIPISSIGMIQSVILRKEMLFKTISKVEIVSAFLSGIIGLTLAYNGFGIHSLLAQILSLNIIKVLLLLFYKRWHPLPVFSVNSIKILASFGCNMLASSLLTVLFNNIFTLIIGKTSTTSEVGNYNQAKKFEEISSDTITNVILSVSFPALINYKDDVDKLREAYSMVIKTTILIIAPLMLMLMLSSHELFQILLTDKWLGAVPYFKILCIYGLTFPLHQINSNIFKVLGKGRQYLYIEIFRRLLLTLSILITINYGVMEMLVGQIIVMIIVIIVNMYFSGKLINFRVKDQIKDVVPYYLMAILTVIPVSFFIDMLSLDIYLSLITKLVVSGLCYIVFCKLRKDSTYMILKDIVKNNLIKKIV